MDGGDQDALHPGPRDRHLGDVATALQETADRPTTLRIGGLARELGFASVIVVGDADLLAEGAGDIATRVPDAEAALDVVLDEVTDGDVVLVKASRSIGLEAVAEPLIAASKGAES